MSVWGGPRSPRRGRAVFTHPHHVMTTGSTVELGALLGPCFVAVRPARVGT
ncbi:MAG: hypothetical protein ACYCZN_03720 [Candidatus Dormibacteria bacterium]